MCSAQKGVKSKAQPPTRQDVLPVFAASQGDVVFGQSSQDRHSLGSSDGDEKCSFLSDAAAAHLHDRVISECDLCSFSILISQAAITADRSDQRLAWLYGGSRPQKSGVFRPSLICL